VRNEVRRIGRWAEQILHHHAGTQELSQKLAEVTADTAKHREQGYRFCEDDSDPAVLFSGIEHHTTECLNLLNTGKAKTAAEHLTQGFGLVASANERQVQSRAFCQTQRNLHFQEHKRLQISVNNGRRALAELQTSFDDKSWQDIRDNVAMAKKR